MDISLLSHSSGSLSSAPISDVDVWKAIRRLKHSKSAELDDFLGLSEKCVCPSNKHCSARWPMLPT